MSIKVRYFASLKESVGKSEDELQISYPLTARKIWEQLNPDHNIQKNVLVAVNMEYADLDTEIRDGNELAFFPPVTGG